MAARILVRHGVPLLLGAATVAMSWQGLAMGATVSLGLGALVWLGGALVLNPPRLLDKTSEARSIPIEQPMFKKEVEDAVRRIARLRMLRERVDSEPLRDSLEAIADSATVMISDLRRNPSDYRRLRKALNHYLRHVEIVTERYAYMRATAPVGSEIKDRVERTLGDLQQVFLEYNRRMVEDEAYDLDARLALLEQQIAGEGIADEVGTATAGRGQDQASDR